MIDIAAAVLVLVLVLVVLSDEMSDEVAAMRRIIEFRTHEYIYT